MKMLRYTVINRDTIEVDLENNYKVIALAAWNNIKKQYYITLMIHENSVNLWNLVEKAENLPLQSNIKSIKRNMAMLVTNLLTEGFFKYYIERYEYELKCFDRGNTLFEKDRTGTKNV